MPYVQGRSLPLQKTEGMAYAPLEETEGMAYAQGKSLPLEETEGMAYMFKADVSP